MSKVRVILKPAGFVTAAIIAMILTIIAVFIVATQPELFERRAGGGNNAAAPATAAPPLQAATDNEPPSVPATAKTLKDWLVLSPLLKAEKLPDGSTEEQKVQAMNDLLKRESLPNEYLLAPRAGDTVRVGEKNLKWRRQTATLLNFFTGADASDNQSFCTGIAVATVDLPEAVPAATLYVGSDDGVVVWLNGREILRNPILRQCVPGDDKITNLSLKAGQNVFVFKVGQGENDWTLTAALETGK